MFSVTSVALSAWSLMLINAWSSLSDPRLMHESPNLLKVAHGSTGSLWLCRSYHMLFLEGDGPKRLSSSVSLSLDSLDNSSGGLEVEVVCILGRSKEQWEEKSEFESTFESHQEQSLWTIFKKCLSLTAK